MTRTALDFNDNWLDPEDMDWVRARMPIPYINAVPVHLGTDGLPSRIGLLLRSMADGTLGRELVGGRIKHGETIREALLRHAENDLGSLAMPDLPLTLVPFHIAEYFPEPGKSPFVDPRQHAVALCYILPVRGQCAPRHDALSLDWLTPQELTRPDITSELSPGQNRLITAALAHLGILP